MSTPRAGSILALLPLLAVAGACQGPAETTDSGGRIDAVTTLPDSSRANDAVVALPDASNGRDAVVALPEASAAPDVALSQPTDAPIAVDVPLPTSGVPITFQRDATGMPSIVIGGVNLLGGTGAYYIIGSCTGADDPGQNVISTGATGGVLRAPGRCPGAPFRVTTTLTSPRSVHVSLQVGPLPVDYRTLSVPLDARKTFFTTLRTASSAYEVGCGLSWTPRAGSEARFDAIPTPCEIPGFGFVGAARVVPLPMWGEIQGPYAVIRRTITSGDGRELTFYNHPATNNIEVGFNPDFATVLRAGTVVRLEEDIVVTPPADGFPTRAEILLPLVYRGVLGREPDVSGVASHGPRVQATGAVGMGEVAAAMLASPEFATLRGTRSSTVLVDQMYRGLLGRGGDPEGLRNFVPIADAGRHIEVVRGLIASSEFRSAFPLAY